MPNGAFFTVRIAYPPGRRVNENRPFLPVTTLVTNDPSR